MKNNNKSQPDWDKDKVKRFVRNGFVVFDRLLEKFKDSFGETMIFTSCPPTFGKVRNYDNENFNCDMVYLNQEKTNQLLKRGIELNISEGKSIGLANLEEGGRVNEYVLSRIRDTSDNGFASFSTIEIKVRKEISEETANAIMLLRNLGSGKFPEAMKEFEPDQVLEAMKLAAKIVLSDREISWVRQIMVFSYENVTLNITFRSYVDPETNRLNLLDTKDELYESLMIGDIRKGHEGGWKLSELFEKEEIPFFIMDLDW